MEYQQAVHLEFSVCAGCEVQFIGVFEQQGLQDQLCTIRTKGDVSAQYQAAIYRLLYE